VPKTAWLPASSGSYRVAEPLGSARHDSDCRDGHRRRHRREPTAKLGSEHAGRHSVPSPGEATKFHRALDVRTRNQTAAAPHPVPATSRPGSAPPAPSSQRVRRSPGRSPRQNDTGAPTMPTSRVSSRQSGGRRRACNIRSRTLTTTHDAARKPHHREARPTRVSLPRRGERASSPRPGASIATRYEHAQRSGHYRRSVQGPRPRALPRGARPLTGFTRGRGGQYAGLLLQPQHRAQASRTLRIPYRWPVTPCLRIPAKPLACGCAGASGQCSLGTSSGGRLEPPEDLRATAWRWATVVGPVVYPPRAAREGYIPSSGRSVESPRPGSAARGR